MKKILITLILIFAIFQIVVLSTEWDVSTAEYSGKSKLVSAEDTYPRGLTFSLDGTKMYISGSGTDSVYQYTLDPAWDVSTATYAEKSKYVNAEDDNPHDVAFSYDGTKMYIMGAANDTVYQYTLGTAWDVSTATYAEKNKSVNAQDTYPRGLTFSLDGTKMYVSGTSNDKVYQYTLTTGWDVSTATYAKFVSVTNEDSSPYDVAFKPDGTKMYIMGYANDTVYQYTLDPAWDVSTATYAEKSKYVNAEDSSPCNVFFSSDGSKMYIMGSANDTVFQYTLPEAPIGWPHKWNTKEISKWNTKEIVKWNDLE